MIERGVSFRFWSRGRLRSPTSHVARHLILDAEQLHKIVVDTLRLDLLKSLDDCLG